MEDIERKYHDLENDFIFLCSITEQQLSLYIKLSDDEGEEVQNAIGFLQATKTQVLEAINKAKSYDIERFKKSQGGKKSSQNMTKEERIARARKAGSVKKGQHDTKQSDF